MKYRRGTNDEQETQMKWEKEPKSNLLYKAWACASRPLRGHLVLQVTLIDVTPRDTYRGQVSHGTKNFKRMANKILPLPYGI